MADGSSSAPVSIYLPYVDERAAGLQRYASHMVIALMRSGLDFELIIGELHGLPDWLFGIPHRVGIGGALARRLPRPLAALMRMVWLQIVVRQSLRRKIFLALGHELIAFPKSCQIAVVHDLTDFKAFAQRSGLMLRMRSAIWKIGLKRSAAIVAISEATRRDLLDTLQLNRRQIEVVYEGVDAKLFKPRSPPNPKQPPFLLYAGTLDPHKNVPFLLEVYRQLRERVDEVTLKLVGRHDQRRVRGLVESIPEALRNDVDFVGFVSDDRLAELMADCAAFVFPSRNEGFGLAPAEAMACGAPVLAADAGSLPEVIGSGGVLLPLGDLAPWVSELERLLTDPDYRPELSARALARSQAFSWPAAADAYRKIIEAVQASRSIASSAS